MRNNFAASACIFVPHPLSVSLSKPHGFPGLAGAHQRSPHPLHQNTGRRTKRDTTGAMNAMSTDASSGRTTGHAMLLPPTAEVSCCTSASAGMTAATTSPTTSSMIAALMSTVPMRDCFSEFWGVGPGDSVAEVSARCAGESVRVRGRAQVVRSESTVSVRPLVREAEEDLAALLSAASVVPRLSEESAAPAANASRGR